jgi:hypothetical protein
MSKSVEELFKGAPQGATHYCMGAISGHWRDLSEQTWKFYRVSDGTWHDTGDKTTSLLHNGAGLTLIERPPQPKPWSGPEDGLPPVGERVEFTANGGYNWREATILYKDGQAFLLDGYCLYKVADHDIGFRAIRNKEQQAADKRETAIRELMDIAQVDCRVTAARLVDAGFKREECKSDCSTNNRGVPELLGPCDCR